MIFMIDMLLKFILKVLICQYTFVLKENTVVPLHTSYSTYKKFEIRDIFQAKILPDMREKIQVIRISRCSRYVVEWSRVHVS